MFVVLVIQNRIAIQASHKNLTNYQASVSVASITLYCNIGLVLLMSIVWAISERSGGFVRTFVQ